MNEEEYFKKFAGHFKKLEDYIHKRLERGHYPDHIKKTLLEHGWKESHIHKYLREKAAELAKEQEKKKPVVIHETEFDRLYALIQKKEKVRITEVMAVFKINQKLAQKWADILKKAKLIEVYYPAMGGIELRRIKK